jgi:hypothetical protein
MSGVLDEPSWVMPSNLSKVLRGGGQRRNVRPYHSRSRYDAEERVGCVVSTTSQSESYFSLHFCFCFYTWLAILGLFGVLISNRALVLEVILSFPYCYFISRFLLYLFASFSRFTSASCNLRFLLYIAPADLCCTPVHLSMHSLMTICPLVPPQVIARLMSLFLQFQSLFLPMFTFMSYPSLVSYLPSSPSEQPPV